MPNITTFLACYNMIIILRLQFSIIPARNGPNKIVFLRAIKTVLSVRILFRSVFQGFDIITFGIVNGTGFKTSCKDRIGKKASLYIPLN